MVRFVVFLMLELPVKFMLGLVWVFINCLDVCDALLVTGFIWLICSEGFKIHSGISLLVGVAVALPLYILFTKRIGFWIVTGIFSMFWSWAFVELIVKGFKPEIDVIWYWIWFGAAMLWNVGAHQLADDRNRKVGKRVRAELADGEQGNGSKNVSYEETVWFDPLTGKMRPISEKPVDFDTPEYQSHMNAILKKRYGING